MKKYVYSISFIVIVYLSLISINSITALAEFSSYGNASRPINYEVNEVSFTNFVATETIHATNESGVTSHEINLTGAVYNKSATVKKYAFVAYYYDSNLKLIDKLVVPAKDIQPKETIQEKPGLVFGYKGVKYKYFRLYIKVLDTDIVPDDTTSSQTGDTNDSTSDNLTESTTVGEGADGYDSSSEESTTENNTVDDTFNKTDYESKGPAIENKINYLMYIIPIVGAIIAFLLWYIFGRDDKVVEVECQYPPDEYSSLEIGYMYKGVADTEDVASLLLYLANKGYIKIVENENKGLLGRDKIRIVKLKDYDGTNVNEELFFNGLFAGGITFDMAKGMLKSLVKKEEIIIDANNSIEEIGTIDLNNRFYRTLHEIQRNVNSKKIRNALFETKTSGKGIFVILFIIVSYLAIFTLPVLHNKSFEEAAGTALTLLFLTPFLYVGIAVRLPVFFRVFWLGLVGTFFITLIKQNDIIKYIIEDPFFIVGFIISIIGIVVMIICAKFMSKRTAYGNEILGKIRGFRNFMEKGDIQRIRSLMVDNPKYFYEMLPYAYVLKISPTWIKRFDGIEYHPPEWFESADGTFTLEKFNKFLHKNMAEICVAMSSEPSSND